MLARLRDVGHAGDGLHQQLEPDLGLSQQLLTGAELLQELAVVPARDVRRRRAPLRQAEPWGRHSGRLVRTGRHIPPPGVSQRIGGLEVHLEAQIVVRR